MGVGLKDSIIRNQVNGIALDPLSKISLSNSDFVIRWKVRKSNWNIDMWIFVNLLGKIKNLNKIYMRLILEKKWEFKG